MPQPSLNRATIEFTSIPAPEELENNIDLWRTPKLCYNGGDANGEMVSCRGKTGIVVIPDNSYNCFNW